MNKAFRLALLLSLACLASWSATSRAAHATLPPCDGFDGNSCPVANRTVACSLSDGSTGSCTCFGHTHIWVCG